MTDARAELLSRVMAEVAENGLADRSLREIASAVGSSHRMLNYHFGSRAGLVAAIVEAVEVAERDLLLDIAADAASIREMVLALWRHTSSSDMAPFVRLFFECVAATGGEGLTGPWLEVAGEVAEAHGVDLDPDELRLGVAVSRGLLIDVLATGDSIAATRAMERFVEMWDPDGRDVQG